MSSIGTSAAMVEALHVLGVSIVWIAILIGIDKYGDGNDIVLASVYPLAIFSWSIGAFSWALYLLHRLMKSGIRIPLLIRLQTSLAVGLITLMGVMLNDDSMGTVSSVWTWGTLVTIVLLMGSSMIATAWRSEKIGHKQIGRLVIARMHPNQVEAKPGFDEAITLFQLLRPNLF